MLGPSPLTRGRPAAPASPPAPRGSIPAHAGPPVGVTPTRWRAWVHPRSRGAARDGLPLPRFGWGPSPLTRGRPPWPTWRRLRCRSIPAHAGPPCWKALPTPPTRVHPRSRGAALADHDPGQQIGGSIPAHAGPPWSGTGTTGRHRVHPRSRGAAPRGLMRWCLSLGPSPLTRGRPDHAAGGGVFGGSIPAHAGRERPAAPPCTAGHRA